MRLFLRSIMFVLTAALPTAVSVPGFTVSVPGLTIALSDYDGAAATTATPGTRPDAGDSTIRIADQWSIDSPTLAPSSVEVQLGLALDLVAPGSAGVYRLPVSGDAARHVVFDRVEAAVLRHGGQAVENDYMFPTRRAARQAASEISGDLGSATEAIRASDFPGGPRWMENSDQVIGRSSADGLTGWRDDFLSHTFRDGMQLGPHVNVWASGIDSSLPHLFYPGAMG